LDEARQLISCATALGDDENQWQMKHDKWKMENEPNFGDDEIDANKIRDFCPLPLAFDVSFRKGTGHTGG